eukprot:1403181-Pyramimonas_sp.AAC.1
MHLGGRVMFVNTSWERMRDLQSITTIWEMTRLSAMTYLGFAPREAATRMLQHAVGRKISVSDSCIKQRLHFCKRTSCPSIEMLSTAGFSPSDVHV